MLVSISDAAKMAGITRSTLYTHIEEKNISVVDKDTKRPKIDTSELIRVYGDKVKPLEAANDGSASRKLEGGASDRQESSLTELAVLRERLKNAELERDRERRQLSDQIENLQELLRNEQEVVGKVTAQLTDTRSVSEKQAAKEAEQAQKFIELETTVKALLEAQHKGWWPFRKRA
jgi:hypothetical protein